MAVSKRLRYEVLRRDNHACRYCGGVAPDVKLTVDHVVPVALGGGDDPSNLVAACRDCNAGKSASAPDAALVDDVAQDALRWRRAMQVVIEQDHDQFAMRQRMQYQLASTFSSLWDGYVGRYDDVPDDYSDCLVQMSYAGMARGDMEEGCRAVRRCRYRPKDEWRYFCGVVWSRIRERQGRACDLIESGAVD